MFSIDTQEVHDANTGVAIAFGDHGNSTCWMRITVPGNTGDGSPQKISTVFFQKDGDVLRIVAHGMSPGVNEETAKELSDAQQKEAELAAAAHELFDKDEPADEEVAPKKKRG